MPPDADNGMRLPGVEGPTRKSHPVCNADADDRVSAVIPLRCATRACRPRKFLSCSH